MSELSYIHTISQRHLNTPNGKKKSVLNNILTCSATSDFQHLYIKALRNFKKNNTMDNTIIILQWCLAIWIINISQYSTSPK